MKVEYAFQNLEANKELGFHIHTFGDPITGCTSFGGHFNPEGQHHGDRLDTVRHVGDFGNIQTDDKGSSVGSFNETVASLYNSHSIMGRGCMIHADTDDLGKGNSVDSLSTGNAGPRKACGIIGHKYD